MPLTAEQLARRKEGVGASEVAAILGVDPHRTAIDVWLEKTGKRDPFEGNEYTLWGNRLEAVIADEYAERMKVIVRRDVGTLEGAEPWMLATPDGIVTDPESHDVAPESWGLECKNRNFFNRKVWGLPGTDQVPVEVAAQCHWSMIVSGYARWDAAVLLGGNELAIYTVLRDDALCEAITAKVRHFWEHHVQGGVTPPIDGSESASRYLDERWRLYSDEYRGADPEAEEFAEQLRMVRRDLADGEARKAALENHLKDFIGDRAGLVLADGSKITWKRPKSRVSTDWRSVAQDLGAMLAPEILSERVQAHTTTAESSRRFVVPRSWSET